MVNKSQESSVRSNNNYPISLSILVICLLDDVLCRYYTGRSYVLIMKKEAREFKVKCVARCANIRNLIRLASVLIDRCHSPKHHILLLCQRENLSSSTFHCIRNLEKIYWLFTPNKNTLALQVAKISLNKKIPYRSIFFPMWLGWSIIPQDISCIWWGWNRRLASQPSSCAWWHMRSSAWLHNFNWYNSQGDVIWRGNNMRQQHGWPITTSRQDSLSLLLLSSYWFRDSDVIE